MVTEKNNESLYNKIHNMDRRYMWWILIMMIIVILINPVNIPISITKPVKSCKAWIDTLPEGSVVMFSQNEKIAQYIAYGESLVNIVEYMLNNDIKIVFFSVHDAALPVTYKVLEAIPNIDEYELGVDYAHFGYYSGFGRVMASMQEDVWGTLGADVYGTPVSEIPLMQNLKRASDFDGWFEAGPASEYVDFIKNWMVPYGVKGAAIGGSANLQGMVTWYENELLEGFIVDQRGAIEFAQLLNLKTKLSAQMDAQSASHLFLIGLILFGNVFYIYEKYVKGGNK